MATRNDLLRYAITDVPGARHGEQGYHPMGRTASEEYAGAPYAGNTGPHAHGGETLRSPRTRVVDPGEGDDYATPGHAYGPARRNVEIEQVDRRGQGPRDYRRSDERVREDVCEALTEDARVDASEIVVDVTEGEVMLSGSVPTRAMKRAAEDAIERCRGVRDVHNRLRIDGTGAARGANPPRPERDERDDAGD